jgi:hypothetical protein
MISQVQLVCRQMSLLTVINELARRVRERAGLKLAKEQERSTHGSLFHIEIFWDMRGLRVEEGVRKEHFGSSWPRPEGAIEVPPLGDCNFCLYEHPGTNSSGFRPLTASFITMLNKKLTISITIFTSTPPIIPMQVNIPSQITLPNFTTIIDTSNRSPQIMSLPRWPRYYHPRAMRRICTAFHKAPYDVM